MYAQTGKMLRMNIPTLDTPEDAQLLPGQAPLPGAVPACTQCGQALPVRLCADCTASIEDRPRQARRCTACSQARRRSREAARQMAARGQNATLEGL